MYVARAAGGRWFYRSVLGAVVSLAMFPSHSLGAGMVPLRFRIVPGVYSNS